MKYPSIRIEGSILSPDLLERLEDLPGQRPNDFGLDSGIKVKDEIARAWADAQDYWRIFKRKLETLKPDAPGTTETRNNWIVPLLGLLKYELEFQKSGAELNGKIYAISHRVINRAQTPLHIVGYRDQAGLDRKPANATLRMSAHAVVQEYINLHEQLYGLVTNGRIIRLLRDSSRLIKQSYLEFDLDRIFNDGLFADFAVLFRLLHATRLPPTSDSAAESIIEKYHQDSLDSGARIREGLSKAVEQAIIEFANGFLSHPENTQLRERVNSGGLTPDAFYKSLLRLIYRLLFLMVIEERNLIFPDGTPLKLREIYHRFYSLARLRTLSEKRYLADKRQHDLWLALLSTFQLFETNGPGVKIGIKPLAGDLFKSDAIDPLDECHLANDVLMSCLRSLGLYEHPDNRQLIRVNYAALNVEEFGSVYEGLLEYEPVIAISGSTPSFSFKMGDERAATGSHYTPDDLVQPLIKHSLDYLIADKLKESDKESALLSLRVADIACGSGHILLAAARRIATELAIVRTGEEQPSPGAFRAAIRDVIRECIYGVDLNPLAVELCKVALWLEAHSPGEPLNFLDHHIKCGNSIVGFVRPEELEKGVPDEAFKTLPGDDKDVAARLRKQNKRERENPAQVAFDYAPPIKNRLRSSLERYHAIAKMPERTPEEIEQKKIKYLDFVKGQDSYSLLEIASIPIAQFYISKTEEDESKLITDAEFRRYWSGQSRPQGQAPAAAIGKAFERNFFHWFIEFPEIIDRGGFDCILGNPPYLGGQALSRTYGSEFCNYIKVAYTPTGLSDLVTFFLRRIFSLLVSRGFLAIITTNSIRDGDVRKDGLETILALGGTINMAFRAIRWPGRAKLVVSSLAVAKGPCSVKRIMDGIEVKHINAFLDDQEITNQPKVVVESQNRIFQGSNLLGNGFIISSSQASDFLRAHPNEKLVLRPIVNGGEINSLPDLKAQRYAFYFSDWDLSEASKFPAALDYVRVAVKPERDSHNEIAVRERWWRYKRPTPELYKKIADLKRCFVAAVVTKYLNFSEMAVDHLFTHKAYVLCEDRWEIFSCLQSGIHESWARMFSGTLGQTLNYSPSMCFETFPFPATLLHIGNPGLAKRGSIYHEHRKLLMLSLWLGLTDVYNLFHARTLESDLKDHFAIRARRDPQGFDIPAEHREKAIAFTYDQALAGLLELRRLHVELDNAVRDAYGWSDLNLGHDFYEVETLPENDRVRYTISPAARKELLQRLLKLNHERAAEEANKEPSSNGKPKRKKSKSESKNLELFASSTGGAK